MEVTTNNVSYFDGAIECIENSVFVTKQFIRTSLTNKNYSELQSQEYYVSNDPHSC